MTWRHKEQRPSRLHLSHRTQCDLQAAWSHCDPPLAPAPRAHVRDSCGAQLARSNPLIQVWDPERVMCFP